MPIALGGSGPFRPCSECIFGNNIVDGRSWGPSADREQAGNHAGTASTSMVPKERERIGRHHGRFKTGAGGGELCSPEGTGQADARGVGRD